VWTSTSSSKSLSSAVAAATAAASNSSPLPMLTNHPVPLTRAPSFVLDGPSLMDMNGTAGSAAMSATSPHGSGIGTSGGGTSDASSPLIIRAPDTLVDTTAAWRLAIESELQYMNQLVETNAGYSQDGSLTGGAVRVLVEIAAGGGLQATNINVTAHDEHLLGTFRKDLAGYLGTAQTRLQLMHRRTDKPTTTNDDTKLSHVAPVRVPDRILTRMDNYRSLGQLGIHSDDIIQVVLLTSAPPLNLLPMDCVPLFVDCMYGIAMCSQTTPIWSPMMTMDAHRRLQGMQAMLLLPSIVQWTTTIHRLIMQHPLRQRLLTGPTMLPSTITPATGVVIDEREISTILTLPGGAHVTYHGLSSHDITLLAPQALSISCIASTSGAGGICIPDSDPSTLGPLLSRLPWTLTLMIAALLDPRSLCRLHGVHRQFAAPDRFGCLWLMHVARHYPRALRDLPWRDRCVGELAYRRCYIHHARLGGYSCVHCLHIAIPIVTPPTHTVNGTPHIPSPLPRCDSCRQ
jgi:hypothetical protein